jgi:excisionase family DNA binding protein
MKVIVLTREELRSILREELSGFLPKSNSQQKRFTTEGAAEYVGLPLATFRQHQHKIGGVKIGKRWQFTQVELDKYIESNRRQSIQKIRENI